MTHSLTPNPYSLSCHANEWCGACGAQGQLRAEVEAQER